MSHVEWIKDDTCLQMSTTPRKPSLPSDVIENNDSGYGGSPREASECLSSLVGVIACRYQPIYRSLLLDQTNRESEGGLLMNCASLIS